MKNTFFFEVQKEEEVVEKAEKTKLEKQQSRPLIEAKYEKIEVYEGKGLAIGIDLDTANGQQLENSKWFKNDQDIFSLNESRIKNDILNNKNILKIDKLTLKDTGKYDLHLVNPLDGK